MTANFNSTTDNWETFTQHNIVLETTLMEIVKLIAPDKIDQVKKLFEIKE